MGRVVSRRETVVALPEEIDLLNATRVAEQLCGRSRNYVIATGLPAGIT